MKKIKNNGFHWRHVGGRRWIHFSVTNEDQKNDDEMDDIDVEVKVNQKAEHFYTDTEKDQITDH